ncbi:MAG: hypothetical protein ACPG3U_07055 [Rhodothermales bacterium]
MGTFVKEYGLIAILTAVALSGYFLIGDRRGDIMDYTLDMIGTRLVELAQGENEKEEIARQFAAFSDRVERNEIAPEAIESVAANVLNLRARGAAITPDEAALMLYPEPPTSLPSPADSLITQSSTYGYPFATSPTKRVDVSELGDRITHMFEIADAVGRHSDAGESHVRFARDEHGVHVVLDPKVEVFFETSSAEDLYAEVSEKEWVRWEANLAEQQERQTRRLERQAERLAALEAIQTGPLDESEARKLDALKRVQNLALMGATTDLDTLVFHQEVESLIEGLTFEIQTMMEGDIGDVIGSSGSIRVMVHSDTTSHR